MFPVIDLGPFAIQAPGLIIILSLWIGFWLMGKFSDALGTNADVIENSFLMGVIIGILSARIGFLLQHPSVFLGNPLSLFTLTLSMMNTSFGLLAGVLSTFIFAQKKHLPLWPTLDTIVPLFILVFIGWHLANFANGDAYGLPTDLPWGVNLWNANRHPVQIYAIILTLCFLIWFMIRTKGLRITGFLRSGLLFQWLVVSLSLITLFTQAFVQEKILSSGIDLIQAFSFLILLADLALIYQRRYTPRKRIPVFISLGSNVQPEENLFNGIKVLKSYYEIIGQSSVYQSPDMIQNSAVPKFYNQVIKIETDDDYPHLKERLKFIEHEFGREPGDKQHVPIDLDILTYDEDVFTHEGNHIPHPNLTRYHYITQPLAEISPDFRHPATGESIRDISSNLEGDQPDLEKVKE